MPIYEYCCKDCEQIFEEWQRNHDEVEVPCPVCGNEAQRIISNTSFVLKGTGWYVTDYANGRSAPPSAGSSDAAGGKDSAETKSDGSSGGSEAKSESSASPASGGSGAKSEASVPPASGRTAAPKADSSPAQS
ncbi:MAG: zinc ribbon domain-containing protein [Proteobacteria bacterium]|nr:zinc ribbon domain-containing protein [Pseudomonadota bacterium]